MFVGLDMQIVVQFDKTSVCEIPRAEDAFLNENVAESATMSFSWFLASSRFLRGCFIIGGYGKTEPVVLNAETMPIIVLWSGTGSFFLYFFLYFLEFYVFFDTFFVFHLNKIIYEWTILYALNFFYNKLHNYISHDQIIFKFQN